jgi:predicted enzyme related to lactoylglutathione lyase
MPPMDIPGAVSMAQFADPSGNVIGLVKANSMVAE